MVKIKNLKRIFTLLFVFTYCVMTFGSLSVFAEQVETAEQIDSFEEIEAETGWVELSVSVPDTFTNQIYVQLQEISNIAKDSDENYIQINRHNDYMGKISLPVGTYTITDMYVYENPDMYTVRVATDIELPINVTSSTTATSLRLECTAIGSSVEGTEQQEGNINPENAETEATEEDVEVKEKTEKSPLYRLAVSFIKNLIWFIVIGAIGYVVYHKFYLNN